MKCKELLSIAGGSPSSDRAHHPPGDGSTTASTGAVTLVQRFGSALNSNIHLGMLFLDGVYFDGANRSSIRFRCVKAPRVLSCLNWRTQHRSPQRPAGSATAMSA